jgi:hypothetical protein
MMAQNATHLAMNRSKSVDFIGYWQRHVSNQGK